jgi:hypothetical protein
MWRKKEARTGDVTYDFHWQKALFSFYYLLAKLSIDFDGMHFIKWAEEYIWPIKRSED